MGDVNLNTDAYVAWNASVSDVRRNVAFARVLCVGDSITQGTFAASYANTYPSKLLPLVAGSQNGAIWTDGDWNLNPPWFGPVSWHDSRVTKNAPWAVQAVEGPQPEVTMMGGGGWYTPSVTANALSFALPWSVDTINVFYAGSTSNGVFGINVDGGASLGTFDTRPGSGTQVGTASVTCAAGVHTINLQPATVAGVVILGLEAYLSTSKKILIANGGSGGSTSANWITTNAAKPWLSYYSSVGFGNANLYIVMLGTNDALAGVAAATYQTRMATLIQHLQASGQVLLVSSVPSQSAAAWALEQQYVTSLMTLATTYSCGLIDLTLPGRFVNYTTANANGYMADANHPNPAGYAFLAGIINDYGLGQITAPPVTPPALGAGMNPAFIG